MTASQSNCGEIMKTKTEMTIEDWDYAIGLLEKKIDRLTQESLHVQSLVNILKLDKQKAIASGASDRRTVAAKRSMQKVE